MEAGNHWLINAGLVTSSIIAVTANAFLLLIFCKRRSLRTVPNRFVINLLATNLLSSILLIPFLIADQEFNATNTAIQIGRNNSRETSQNLIANETTITTTINQTLLCYAAQSGTSFVCTLSILSILLIGINQYFGVIHSLRYHFYINKCRSSIFIVTIWIVALIFGALSSVGQTDRTLWRFCARNHHQIQDQNFVQIFNTIYAFSYFVIVILAPFVAICVIYLCIYSAAHKNSERMRQSTSANLDHYIQVQSAEDGEGATFEKTKELPRIHSAPNFVTYNTELTIEVPAPPPSPPPPSSNDSLKKVQRTVSERNDRNNFITSLKHKISNASVFRCREETRAAKISVLVVFLVLFCYIPYGITLILNSAHINLQTSNYLNSLSLILLVFSNIISPFLFAYRNKRVKREIVKILGFAPPSPIKCQNFDTPKILNNPQVEPFLNIPQVIVTCKVENERKSILKRVCDTSAWTNCKKCNFMQVPEGCLGAEARGSFSSASTQISNED